MIVGIRDLKFDGLGLGKACSSYLEKANSPRRENTKKFCQCSGVILNML
jgi:hypothetical protein